MSKETGGAAFPAMGDPQTDNFIEGMTLRDYFAAKAMEALIIKWTIHKTFVVRDQNWAAQMAYEFADAMLKERDK